MVSALVRASRITDPEPPKFNASHTYSKRLRFICTQAVNQYPINTSDLTALLYVNLTAITADGDTVDGSPLWSRIRLQKVEAWATGQVTGASGNIGENASNLELSFFDPSSGNSANPEVTASDIATSDSRYAHVSLKPPQNSSASQWQNASTQGTGFKISCPENTIVDVTLQVYINNGDPLQQPFNVYVNSNVGIPSGTVLCGYLDPVANGGGPGYFPPVGYNGGITANPTPRV